MEVALTSQPCRPILQKHSSPTKGQFPGQIHGPAAPCHNPSLESEFPNRPGVRCYSGQGGGQGDGGGDGFQALGLCPCSGRATPAFWLATLILLGVYIIISLEWLHRALAGLLGPPSCCSSPAPWDSDPAFFLISFAEAIAAIDMNVIFLLLGMMIIVGVTKKTGLFQWLAYKAYALARGNIFVLAVILMWVTAVTSAFLDNVTTMLLLIPVTIEIALTLKLNPISLLIPEVFASNVGGTATLIGDPPNILIGSYTNLTFGAFVSNLTLICIVCMLVTAVYFVYWHKQDYVQAEVTDVARTIAELRQVPHHRPASAHPVPNSAKFHRLPVHHPWGAAHGTVGGGPDRSHAAVGGLPGGYRGNARTRSGMAHPDLLHGLVYGHRRRREQTGLIQIIAEWVREVSQGNLTLAILIVLWVSALASAFIDNIPFTATMLPIIAFLNATIPGAESGVLWWALALGACLGGNGTMIGASANVVTVGLAERAGYHISFLAYMKACFVPMLITIVLCSGYLLIFFR